MQTQQAREFGFTLPDRFVSFTERFGLLGEIPHDADYTQEVQGVGIAKQLGFDRTIETALVMSLDAYQNRLDPLLWIAALSQVKSDKDNRENENA